MRVVWAIFFCMTMTLSSCRSPCLPASFTADDGQLQLYGAASVQLFGFLQKDHCGEVLDVDPPSKVTVISATGSASLGTVSITPSTFDANPELNTRTKISVRFTGQPGLNRIIMSWSDDVELETSVYLVEAQQPVSELVFPSSCGASHFRPESASLLCGQSAGGVTEVTSAGTLTQLDGGVLRAIRGGEHAIVIRDDWFDIISNDRPLSGWQPRFAFPDGGIKVAAADTNLVVVWSISNELQFFDVSDAGFSTQSMVGGCASFCGWPAILVGHDVVSVSEKSTRWVFSRLDGGWQQTAMYDLGAAPNDTYLYATRGADYWRCENSQIEYGRLEPSGTLRVIATGASPAPCGSGTGSEEDQPTLNGTLTSAPLTLCAHVVDAGIAWRGFSVPGSCIGHSVITGSSGETRILSFE